MRNNHAVSWLVALLTLVLVTACSPAVSSTDLPEATTVSSVMCMEPSPTPAASTTARPAVTSHPTSTPVPSPSASPAASPTPVPTLAPTLAPTVTPAVTSVTSTSTAPVTPTADTVENLHQDALVIDAHNDTVLKIIDSDTWLPKNKLSRITNFMVDIPKLVAGGIDVATFASYTSGYAQPGGGQDFDRANSRLLALLNALHWTMDQNPDTTRQVLDSNDLQNSNSQGSIGFLLSIEGAYSLNAVNSLALLRQYHDLGVLMLAPVWNYSNELGEGTKAEYPDGSPSSGGLTDLGRTVIEEMNRLGTIVDVSHMNEQTFWDTLGISSAPVIASHSSVDALCPNARNLTDRQILAIADSGGLVHVNYYRNFLAGNPSSATVKTLVDHIEYIVNLAGIDHIGLGSDFDGASLPLGLADASHVPAITRELLERGYSYEAVGKILGGNSARVFSKIWKQATVSTSDVGPVVETDLSMGAPLAANEPLQAMITDPATVETASMQIIIDGIVYSPDYDAATGIMQIMLPVSIREKFHVVTFLAKTPEGVTTRETRIFYLN